MENVETHFLNYLVQGVVCKKQLLSSQKVAKHTRRHRRRAGVGDRSQMLPCFRHTCPSVCAGRSVNSGLPKRNFSK